MRRRHGDRPARHARGGGGPGAGDAGAGRQVPRPGAARRRPRPLLVLAWGEFAESSGIHKAGGYLGLLTALAAWYASFAGVTAFAFKRPLVPTGAR